nr:unnamed protein product [Callosobruchus analis]
MIRMLESSSNSSSSSSDNGEFLETVSTVTLTENLRDTVTNEHLVEDTVPLYNEKQLFIEHFSTHYPRKDTGFTRITPNKCILPFLWFASNEAASFWTDGDRFNLSVSHLYKIMHKVIMFLSQKASEIIVWPSPEDIRLISEDFAQMGFESMVGCIGGTYIRIDAPGDDPGSYLNRKKY